jgi:hypothetical protein
MSSRFRGHEARIQQIFGVDFKDTSRRMLTLEIYKKHFEEKLSLPIDVCGREDFSWEEFYLLGPGDKREYEELKRNQASYTDKMKLTGLAEKCNEFWGLFAYFTRVSDSKQFELPLADFKAVHKKSTAYDLLEDYSIWFVNY